MLGRSESRYISLILLLINSIAKKKRYYCRVRFDFFCPLKRRLSFVAISECREIESRSPFVFFFPNIPSSYLNRGNKTEGATHLFAFIRLKREKTKWNERRKKKWNIRVPVYRFNLELISKIRSNSDLATIISSNYIFVQLTRWRVDACGYSKPDNNSIN